MLSNERDGYWITRYSERGEPYRVWIRDLMSRVRDEFNSAVFYLYPSRDEAETGAPIGGTGFFVSINGDNEHEHIYAVTNRHNISKCRGTVVLRAVKEDGSLGFITSDDTAWFPSPRHDISVLPIDPLEAPNFSGFMPKQFVTKEKVEHYKIGPGDDVYMIGRFIGHDGGEVNNPSTRFGNISMLPAPILAPDGAKQESFAVEMRSISGYSGSPVFVYWDFMSSSRGGKNRNIVESYMALLGVDWGHINHDVPVLNQYGKEHPEKLHIRSNSAMCGVVPAWHLADFLELEMFKKQRRSDETSKAKGRVEKGVGTSYDFAEPPEPTTDENPQHREDFEKLLSSATRPKPK